MLIQESLLNPLIQNCKLKVIEDHSFVIVDISASNPLTQSILLNPFIQKLSLWLLKTTHS